jgi:beta-galactosidase/beta-glucuronidase
MTQWGKEISPDKPVWPEYPRPQLTRAEWLNLNGMWDYAIVPKNTATVTDFQGKILVPFCPQSVLSQVNKPVDPANRIWYRRTFKVPAAWAGRQVLLHFGAVNWDTTVSINGQVVGSHQGGYDAFDFDITSYLKAAGPQEVVLSVWNPVEGGQPRGKQSLKPGGIFYTPTTGIWQTVWLEPVSKSHIADLKMVTDIDKGVLDLTVNGGEAGQAGQVDVVVSADGNKVGTATGTLGTSFSIPIPNAKLWWPTSPFLYQLKITLRDGGKKVDEVKSYFGMRKISIGPDEKGVTRMLLNNKFVFENGFLDQGFWPDGIYTAPSDEALRSDLERTRELGFNMLRKHIKVEPARWYYWADKLGVLVWQDMPAAIGLLDDDTHHRFIADRQGEYEKELRAMVEQHINHPSIVVWVLFNEGWGLSMKKKTAPGEKDSPSDEAKDILQRMTALVRQLDPTRLINTESGAGGGKGANPETFWSSLGFGDIIDFHCYGGKQPPDGPEPHRAAVVGEYGYGVSSTGSGTGMATLAQKSNLSAQVLTQLTDVENETNGALHYDRSVKGKVDPKTDGDHLISNLQKLGFDYPGGPSN